VPRISIHAFCEFPDTGAALERAGTDRRLSKAHLTVQLGGVQAAVDHYQGQVTPNLLIVETRLQGQEALDDLDKLAEVCDSTTKVVIVGRANDVELYRELMRRGASEYLVAPVNPLHLIEVVSGLYLDPEAAPIGRVVAFMGARGGAGSSTLAHNVGWYIAEELRINTTIVDFDMAFGTTGLNFNEESGQGVGDALSAPERLDDVLLDRLLIKRGDRLSLFTTPATLERETDAPSDAYESVIDGSGFASQCKKSRRTRKGCATERCAAEACAQPARAAQAPRNPDEGLRRNDGADAFGNRAVRSCALRYGGQQWPDADGSAAKGHSF
jgi:pilus assembly protein CpaE